MRGIAFWLGVLVVSGCAGQPQDAALLAPCPPAVLPTCHAQAEGCGGPPFCYRTLGRIDCYTQPEPARRTVEELAAPAACYVSSRPSATSSHLRASSRFASM